MNPVVAIIASVGVGTLLVIGLAVINAYEASATLAASGDPSGLLYFVPVGVLAFLAVTILSVVTRVR